MNKCVLILIHFFLFIINPCFAMVLPENHSVNGGLTIIPIDIKQEPVAYYEGSRIVVLPSDIKNQWLLLVAIPLKKTDTIQYIQITKPIKTLIPFQVSDKVYNTQYLTIKDLSKVDPQPADLKRIDLETKKLTKIFASYTNVNPFNQAYAAPITGAISSLFGLNRFYNKQPRDPHSGLDIAAQSGQEVHAVNEGTVVETGDYFFTGNTVIVDHGMGVFSLYAHLSKINVKIGDKVGRGQLVGLVGKTGRATGPHLHWTMVVNQTLVEPLLFVQYRNIAIAPKPPLQPVNRPSTADNNNKKL